MNFNAEPKIIQDILSLERESMLYQDIKENILGRKKNNPGILGGY